MSCNTCNKVIDTAKNGLQYSLKDLHTISVEGESLLQPLLAPAKAPRGGWFFDMYLQGHSTRISGRDPLTVATEVARLLSLNEILYTSTQLWLNLNIQWVGRAVEKYQRIRLPHLLALSTQNF